MRPESPDWRMDSVSWSKAVLASLKLSVGERLSLVLVCLGTFLIAGVIGSPIQPGGLDRTP